MAARKNLKKPSLRSKKPNKPSAKPLTNGFTVKASKNSIKQANERNTRKRKADENGDENHNEKRYSKRARIISVKRNTKTKSNKSVKISLKLPAKATPTKNVNRSSKVKLKATTAEKKLKGRSAVSSRKEKVAVKKNSTSGVQSKKVTKKIKDIDIPQITKKKRSLKKIVSSDIINVTEANVPVKKRKSTKKALVPKDFVTEYLKDPTFETSEFIPHISTLTHSRLLIRAINLNDIKMMKSLINDKKSICSFRVPRSLNINRDAFSYALEKQNMEAIKILLDNKLSKNLATFPEVILLEERTGHNSTMMFGHALRNVTVGRGGKEGNNALLKDRNIYYSSDTYVNFITYDMAKEALSFGLPKVFIQKLCESFPDLQSGIYNMFFTGLVCAIRAGHNQLAGQLVDEALTRGGYGFNQLHKEVLLNIDEPLSSFKSVSVIKKVIHNDRITPLHCAAINPNPTYLTDLLNSRPDYTMLDTQNWSVMHYASVCTGIGPLQVLLSRGISPLQVNKDGDTPLHLASALGRIENVKLILKHEKENENETEEDSPKDIAGSLVERVNKVGQTALHKAAAGGQTDIIPILLTAGASSAKFTPARYEKLTPFMLAARYGHADVLKIFIDHGVNIETVDHKGRSALAHAIINGQAHVVSYLLRIGANNLKKDTSGNTLVHYAAAYGWYFCLKLLLEAGCSPNEPNDWKMTPLAISFMKGHMGLVEYILKQPGVDIDSRINDSTGVTLLLQAISSIPGKEFLSRLKFLLLNQKANCNIVDFEGNNAFHYLVETEYRAMSKDANYLKSETQKIVSQATKLLWNQKCDPGAKNYNQETPIFLAIKFGCFPILNHLFDLSPALPEEPNKKGNTLLHIMVNQANREEANEICKKWAADTAKLEILKKMAGTYNFSGYTPLLWLLNRVINSTHDQYDKPVLRYMDFLVNTLKSDVSAIDLEAKSRQSVLHHAANVNYAEDAFKIIMAMHPPMEVLNYHLQTPLAYAIANGKEIAAKALLNNGADVNVQMKNMNSLLLLHAVSQNKSFHLVPLMIDKGANIHEINRHTKNSILHYVCRKPHLPFAVESVRKLVEKKINIDAVNKDGRTALHLAVNFRGGETDASYDVEDLLIESKAKLNIRDLRGRTPLHMAFVKVGKHTDSSFMDPIELVTTLVRAMKQSLPNYADEIRLADEFGCTPLHYAAFRGATISCSYLLMEMNDNVDILDMNGNTPFGLAVLNGHEACALQFQQKGANFVQNLNTNLSPNAINEGTVSWQWIFIKKKNEENAQKKFERENYPILQEVVRKDWQGILHLMLEKLNNSGNGASFAIAAAMNTKRLKLARKLVNRAHSSELLVNGDRETLLHILAKSGTNADINCDLSDQTVKIFGDRETLLHILSKSGTNQDIHRDLCEQIVNILISKGITYDALDKNESTAVIYAAVNRNLTLCNLLEPTINNQSTDKFGRNPFSALFWNLTEKTEFSDGIKLWAEGLLEQGSQGNICSRYPIIYPVVYPGVRYLNCETNVEFVSGRYTPLMMAVIVGNYSLVEWLLTLRNPDLIDVNYQDDEGRTAIMHAARMNDIEMVRLIINPFTYNTSKYKPHKKHSNNNKNRLLLNFKDKKGWTVMDHVVAVHKGNFHYANSDEIVRVLHSAGAKINEKSGDGVTPLDRAIQMKRYHLVTCMEELISLPKAKRTLLPKECNELFDIEFNRNSPCYSLITDYDKDCQSMVGVDMEIETEDINVVDPDDLVTDNNNDKFKVIFDEEQQVHFSCCLTKVDISYGTYGMYNFYKMQLLKQHRGKELIVLFTRWGRVGDEGQFQKTPFPTVEEAITEYKKIFRSKTGNVWDNLNAFSALPKKYRLVELETKKVEKINQFKVDFDKFQKSNSLKPTNLPLTLVKLIENLALVHKNHIKFPGFDEEYEDELPFGKLKFETLKKGAQLLEQIEELIKYHEQVKTRELFSVTNEVDFMETVLKPSEEFYGLIPVYGFSKEKLKPMFTMDDLREKQKVIHKLIHLEFASQLLTAAQYNLHAVNPFEYMFRCLNAKIESLVEEDEEAQLILQYIHNTSTHPQNQSNAPKINRIYRIERSEEIDRMRKCGIDNKHLLWHGTSSVNVLSILHRGLKVTPLEANLSGHLFGKGIYFADMFMKSQKYSHGSNPKYMFLCEVALGKIHPIKLSYCEINGNKPLPTNCHSLKTVDSRWEPDTATTVIFKGRTMPLGRAVENVLPEGQYHGLDHNEFIVFRDDQVKLRYLIQYED